MVSVPCFIALSIIGSDLYQLTVETVGRLYYFAQSESAWQVSNYVVQFQAKPYAQRFSALVLLLELRSLIDDVGINPRFNLLTYRPVSKITYFAFRQCL